MRLTKAFLLILVCSGWYGSAIADESDCFSDAPTALVDMSGDWAFAYTVGH